MKICPYCAEEIQDAAVKCKHCGEMLHQEPAAAGPEVSGPTGHFGAKPVALAAVACAILLLITIWAGVSHKRSSEAKRLSDIEKKAAEAYATYHKEALETVDELTKIDAAVETGLNIMRYSELLGEVNYRVKRFKDNYDGKVESRFATYESIDSAMKNYKRAADTWRLKNELDSGDEALESVMQSEWKQAGTDLENARLLLKKPAQEVPEWRRFYKAYVMQATGSEKEAEFAEAHRPRVPGESPTPDSTPTVSGDQQLLVGCKSNLKNIGTALEMFSVDHAGRYPTDPQQLVPNYLKTIPTCPAYGAVSYKFQMASSPDLYTVVCSGLNHQSVGINVADYPQYTSVTGLIERP